MDRTEIIQTKKHLYGLLLHLPAEYMLEKDVSGDLDLLYRMTADPDIQKIIGKGFDNDK